MKRRDLVKMFWAIIVVMFFPLTVSALDLPPIVSTRSLEENLYAPGLVILDVRKVEYYREGHIPGAINAFYRAWPFKKVTLNAEVPDMEDLFDLIGSNGITPSSRVVIVGKTDSWQERVHMARVACTLKYAGVERISILDGGHNKWVRDGKVLSREAVHQIPIVFTGKIDKNLFVDKDYIQQRLGKILLVDVREPAFYPGQKKAAVAARAGRIPGAVNLPTSWMFTGEGTFKSKDDLAILASVVVGQDPDREMITYCDTGTCCPTWHFVLREVLGYKRVYLYDGSIEEWTADPNAPVQ